MPLIDCHVHTWEWMGFTPDGEGPAYWERCLAWGARFDATFVVSAPKAPGQPLIHDPSPEYCAAANRGLWELLQRSGGRALGLCYVNPKHPAAALAEMETWIARRGFVGLKLLAALHCDQPQLDPLVEWCAAQGVPVCQHTWVKATGNTPGESTPMMFATLARRHPQATMVMYHSGGDFVYGAKAGRGLENVFFDIGGADAVDGALEALVGEVGAERVLFGSDLPGRSLTSQLAKVLAADLTAREKDLILYHNMARILARRTPPPAPAGPPAPLAPASGGRS